MDEVLRLIEEPYDSSDSETETIQAKNIEEVIIFPPDDANDTDEDSDEENDGDLNHLSSRQLRSQAEVVIEAPEELYQNTVGENKQPARKKSKIIPRKWKNDDNYSPSFIVDEFDINNVESMNCVETFEKVFTDEIVDFLVVMSNTYATHQNHTLNVSRSEMKVYIAILFLTGYMTGKIKII